ncbi:hypothetical protein CRV08_12855 [Halarcobacter ebronensis]|uniref:Retropepsin-like aspartic endopeptidase domain-containing protein n=1 Tax=Halarcobacter ebronensis TaxID=1462615 RepID=A0A4Q0YC76_9BACT|nr:ATP-dependent zinc protease [Halarcobacter ebronensis]RXJ66501.1 hypothetical protein CRV08_12855 [Halarcobacter ebronensis]
MRYTLILLNIFISIFFVACTTQKSLDEEMIKNTKSKSYVSKKSILGDKKVTVGSIEYVSLPAFNLTYKAKIDTGATTTSIHAFDISEFEKDGKKWVKFKLDDTKGGLIEESLPVERVVHIKRHGVENQERYVVKMQLTLGKTTQIIDVSLTDRTKFKYPLLIGKNYLHGHMIVDVSKKFLTSLDEK